MMDETRRRDTGRLALAIGIAAAGSAACLATYFLVQGPFGTINDIGTAATGVLSAGLAWRLRRHARGRAAALGLGAAIVGAALTVVGSASSSRARPASSLPDSCRASASPGSAHGWSP
jgi:hypothetical protein